MDLTSTVTLRVSNSLVPSLSSLSKHLELSRKDRYDRKPAASLNSILTSVVSSKPKYRGYLQQDALVCGTCVGFASSRISLPRGRQGRVHSARATSQVEGETAGEMADMKVVRAAALTCLLGVANRVLYKMALVPLKEYPFFLAQLTTFGYVLVYFSILYSRYKAGIVTKKMLEIPKKQFAVMGVLEALSLASGMAAAAVLPGALISILNQVFLLWQLALSYIFLKKRYSPIQLLGCLLVAVGVAIVVASGSGVGSELSGAGFWPVLLVLSTCFAAGASILKEFVFRKAAESLDGASVDIFVVNSFGSGFQALFVFLLLPFLSKLRGIEFGQLPNYFYQGAGCLLNFGKMGTGCEGAPLVPALYVAANLAFNISALRLLKISSAVVASLAITIAVPLTIAAFTLPLPLLGTPSPLPPGFFLGSAVLVSGLVFYNVLGSKGKRPSKKE